MSPYKKVRDLVADLVRRVGFMLLRTTSEHRAFTDIFTPPYCTNVDWRSGVGDAVFVLYGLVRAQRPQVVVEIGSARGRSSCALALACRTNGKGRVFAIDPHDVNPWTESETGGSTEAFLRARLQDYHLNEWCEVMAMTSVEAAKTWTRKIDLLFIDGDHSFDGVRSDFEMFRSWLAPNALVAFHDTAWNHYSLPEGQAQSEDLRGKLATMGVPRFMEALKHEGYRSITLPLAPGLTILDPSVEGFVFCPPES
jgi:predicted O-methyltransferase YrrM